MITYKKWSTKIVMKDYSEIIKPIMPDILKAKSLIDAKFVKEDNFFYKEIKDFITMNTKRIRTVIIFSLWRALGLDLSDKQIDIANAIELVHNATLFHDDVIDNAMQRRGKKSFNITHSNSLSILAGDYILTIALKLIASLNDYRVMQVVIDTLSSLCQGEIEQNANKKSLVSIDEYINKSYLKTGKLFEVCGEIIEILMNKGEPRLRVFTRNFGIAFQIRDDYNNIYIDAHSTDIKDGIYTAPIIFAAQDFPDILSFKEDKIHDIIREERYKHQTRGLIKKHIEIATESIAFIPDSIYKRVLTELCLSLER